MASITINNRTYEVNPVASELALVAAIKIDQNLFSSYQNHHEFVEALISQLQGFDPGEVATLQGDKYVLALNLEQWFSIISELQAIAYGELLEKAIDSVSPADTLLGEKRALENLALVTVQRQKFQELLEAFDENWAEKISQAKLTKSNEYYKILYSHWHKRLKDLDGNCKKFVQSQIAQIPDKFKQES